MIKQNNYNIYIASREEWDEWEDFNFKYGNVFQSVKFVRVLEKGNIDIRLLLVKEKEEIVAGTFFMFPLTGMKKLFSELRIVSGPIFKNKDKQIFKLILDKLENIAKEHKVIAIQLKTQFTEMEDVLFGNSFIVGQNSPDYSFHIDLLKDEEQLWKELKQTTRTAIRKAKKNNVIVREIRNEQELKTLFNIYIQRARQKKGWIPYDYVFFKNLWYEFRDNHGLFLIATYNDKIIGETIFLIYSGVLYFFNNASVKEFWNMRANNLMVWEGMRFAKLRNSSLFNFYGTSDGQDKNDINYGLYVFKSAFGGSLIKEFQFASKIISPLKNKIFNSIFPKILPLYKKMLG